MKEKCNILPRVALSEIAAVLTNADCFVSLKDSCVQEHTGNPGAIRRCFKGGEAVQGENIKTLEQCQTGPTQF